MTPEKFTLLVSEVVTELDQVEGFAESDGNLYVLSFGDRTLSLDVLFESETVVISADIGVPDKEHEPSIHKFLLSASRAWTSTGGLAFSRDPDGMLSAFYVAALPRLTPTRLRDIILNLSTKASVLRAALSSGVVSAAADETHVSEMHTFGDFFVRV